MYTTTQIADFYDALRKVKPKIEARCGICDVRVDIFTDELLLDLAEELVHAGFRAPETIK